MIQLTPEQREQFKQQQPPRVVVESTEYVLIRSDVYEEVKGLLEEPEEIDPSLYEFDEIETEDDAQPPR